MRPLHAVLCLLDDSTEPIAVYHKSFPDYITDHSRCLDPRFLVDLANSHSGIALRCLELIHDQLRRNILSLPRYTMNEEVPLEKRQKRIGGAFCYACHFFAEHLPNASPPSSLLDPLWSHLSVFLREKQIFWFELLSLTEHLETAVHALHLLRGWTDNLFFSRSGVRIFRDPCRAALT